MSTKSTSVAAAVCVWLRLLRTALLIMVISAIADAQQPSTAHHTAAPAAFAGSLYTVQPQPSAEEEDEIKPARPTVSNPAEFQKPGVLQVEYGYDANFRGRDFSTQQSAQLSVRFAASRRLLLQLDFDTVESQTDKETGVRQTGVGDPRLGFQIVALRDTPAHPAIAFAYSVKLPLASEAKWLGTGRFDHKVVGLLSKKQGDNDIDLNVAYLSNGREGGDGWDVGGQAAFAVSHDFKNNFGLQGEISGQSIDEAQPRGVYTLGAVTYQVNRRLIFDAGMRFGLTHEAPRVGIVAGLTVGATRFFRK